MYYENEIITLNKQLLNSKDELKKPFEYAEELSLLQEEQAQLNAELVIDETPEILLDEENENNEYSVDQQSYEEADELEYEMER